MSATALQSIDNIVTTYFYRGHRYKIIKAFLSKRHGINRSERWVRSTLQRLGLRRNGVQSSPNIQGLIRNVQRETGNRAGYRRTWRIINRHFQERVTQCHVRASLLEMNPDAVRRRMRGVLIRRSYYSAGPNHVWHCDGYDKLKPFGFAIHGCIDGFSRRIMWVHCSTTNNDPRVILGYYLKAVRQSGGCAKLVRSDCGTETCMVAAAQTSLLNNDRAHVYGPSYRNQRIEAWWSILRKSWTQIWIELFEDLIRHGGYVPSNPFHAAIAEFCFMSIIRKEIQEFVTDWNYKNISPTRTSGVPGGVPDELFSLPELYGFSDQLQTVNLAEVELLETIAIAPPVSTNKTVYTLCKEYMSTMQLSNPVDRESASTIFLRMLSSIQ